MADLERSPLRVLWRELSRVRRKQALLTVALLLVAALFEIASVASIIPFLAVLTAPDRLADAPIIGPMLAGSARDPALVPTLALLFIALSLASGAFRLLLTWFSQALAFRAAYDLSIQAFRKIIRQAYEFYIGERSSDVISQFEKINNITYSVLLAGIQAIVSSTIAVLLIVALVAIDPFIALVSGTVVLGTYVVISRLVRSTLAENSRIVAHSWSRRVKQVQEALGGIRDILIDRSQPVFETDFERNADRLQRALTANSYIGVFPRIVIEMISTVLIGALAWHFAGRPGGIGPVIPTLGALALGAQRLLPLLQVAYMSWSQLLASGESLREVARLLSLPLPDQPPPRSAHWSFARRIEFRDVSFGYDAPRPVLKGLDFTVERGERIGIVGRSGSGKSTLMDLVLGLLEPQSGEILVDGTALSGSRRLEWQSQVAHVPQAIYLSDDTVAANIAFGVSAARRDPDLVRQSAVAAGIDSVIRELPQGYDTVVGERGIRLSGGQRQRIGIARALYKRATVLVFDEATSALDSESEAAVMESIAGLSDDMTIFIITHRVSTLSGCDRILRLERGRIDRIVESLADLPLGDTESGDLPGRRRRPGGGAQSRPLADL